MDTFDFVVKRRQMLLGALGTAVGAMFPWERAVAATGDLTIAFPVDVPTWDPNATTFPQAQSIYTTVFDSPLHYSPTLQLQPQQITAWEWQDKHAQRLAVTLRDDILFHDGSKLTTEDLKWTLFERPSLDKKLPIGGMFQSLVNVEIVSPTKAVLVYGKPTPAAPIYLAFLAAYITPKAYMQKVGDGFVSKPVGAGPYRVVDYQRGSRIVLEAFDKYWGGVRPIKNVIFQIMPEPSARVAAVESGNSSVAVQIPLREAKRLEKVAGVESKVYPLSEIYMLEIPSYVKPLNDDNVREAMHFSIDKKLLSNAFYGGLAQPVSVFAAPGTPGDVPGFVLPFDPKRAIAALARSGYGPNKPVKFTLLTTNGDFPNDYDVARAIVGMWHAVGIDADLQVTTAAKIFSEIHAAKMSGVLLHSWANATGDPENGTGRILDPRVVFSAWKDPALAPRIDSLLTEVDESKRIAGYRALDREASEKSWVIPLLQSVAAIAFRSNVELTTYPGGYILPAEYRLK